MEYKIIADSCCDMTAQLRQRLGAESVPMTVRLGQKEFCDDETLDLGKFMSEMKECTERCSSASPSPLIFQEAIEKAKNSFIITVSSKLSGTYENALIGKSFAEEKCGAAAHVFDSKSASAGETLLAVKIRELLDSGMSKENIIESVNKFIDGMKTYFVLERYENLIKNGRLNKITGRIASVLNIKLVMGSDGDGNIALHAKPRGTKNMIEKILFFIKDSGKKTEDENMVISHCNNLSLAKQLEAAVLGQFNFKEVFIVPTKGISSLYADNKGIIMAF